MMAARRLSQLGTHFASTAAEEPATATTITSVRCYCVKLPNIRMITVVKIETAGGLYGVGESGLSFRELAVKGAVQHFAQFLVGSDAKNIAALWQQCYRSQYFEGGRVLTAAMSAIDLALHDIMGKHLGVPVYQLLGGAHRKHVPVYVTCQAAMGEGAVEEAKQLVAEGWPCIRFGGQVTGASFV